MVFPTSNERVFEVTWGQTKRVFMRTRENRDQFLMDLRVRDRAVDNYRAPHLVLVRAGDVCMIRLSDDPSSEAACEPLSEP